MNGLSVVGGFFLVVGFVMLMKLLWINKLVVFYLFGFVLIVYLKLLVVVVVVLGVVICVISL